MLELADRFHDPAFFEQPDAQVETELYRVAEIAEKLGRAEDAKKWFTKAAASGDTEAMRHLIEYYDHGNLQQCWTWVYLAELLGSDLSKDEYYAIHEDGSSYDDDRGGSAFVGGRGGVDLHPISAEQDTSARQTAQEIFEGMDQSANRPGLQPLMVEPCPTAGVAADQSIRKITVCRICFHLSTKNPKLDRVHRLAGLDLDPLVGRRRLRRRGEYPGSQSAAVRYSPARYANLLDTCRTRSFEKEKGQSEDWPKSLILLVGARRFELPTPCTPCD